MKVLAWIAAGLAAASIAAGSAAAQVVPQQAWETLRGTAPLPPVVEQGRQKVGDAELHYAIYGKGKPVILIHPGLGHADYWANQVGPLSQKHQVVVVDLRGHGRSTRSAQPYSYALLAEDVVRLMQKLHLGKAAVVGWGDGAVVGLELAMNHPGRVRELIAFGPTYDLTGQLPGVDKTQTFIDYVHKAAADYARLSPTPQEFIPMFEQMEAMWAKEPNYTADQLRTIKIPTTVIIADHDEWVRPEHAASLADLIPNAQVLTMKGVSHFAPWQAPKRFNEALNLALTY